ncbi:hypothetical protein OROGR_020804 [Orobanche gracilis]
MALNSNSFFHRPDAKFSPSLWGDHFINYISDSEAIKKNSKTVEALKNDVIRSLVTSSAEGKMIDTMNLIDTLERLGLSHHFQNEIQQKLQQVFNLNTDYEAYDLYTVALHFRLFRQHGHPISSEIFGKWMDVDGKFKDSIKSDAKGVLSLYEASYLRTHGETILDDALAFTTATLKSIAPSLGSPLKKKIEHALVQPLHLGVPRVEARSFISLYEEEDEDHKDETLIRFAKLDYNLIQMMHKEELHQVSRWWKELGLISKLPYARDRVVEAFFWTVGVYHQPQYSRARVMFAKTLAIVGLIDDTYDSHGTIEELEVFTEAIDRWDVGEIGRLPEYMRPLYKVLFELHEQFREELAKEGRSYAAEYAIKALKEMARCYLVEAKWLIEGNMPPFEEYLKVAFITGTTGYLAASAMMGIQSAPKEDFEWLSKKPKMLMAALQITRFVNDVATYETEKARGQVASGIECYMKEYGVTKEEAMSKFLEMSTNAWKDSNEEYLRPSCCKYRDVMEKLLNLNRIIEVTYANHEDGFTNPEKLYKHLITALFVEPIQV